MRGTKLAVPDGDIADFAVVVAKSRVGDKASWYLVDLTQRNVKCTPVSTLDPTRSHASITFRSADAELLGAEGEGWALTQKLLDRAAILFAWEQIGGAEAALNQAKEYALGRYAFGRPIASYQAIKHKLATAYIKNTLARSNGYYGAWALNTNAAELRSLRRRRACRRRRRTTSHRRRTSRRTAAWASRGNSTASSTIAARNCCR